MNNVITAGICISRNLSDLPFSGLLSDAQRDNMTQRLLGAVKETGVSFRYIPSTILTKSEKNELISKGLIGEETLSAHFDGCFFINADSSVCITAGEEDHIRIRCSGSDPREAFRTALEISAKLAEKMVFAYDSRFGFLTACPACAGTAMSISAVIHLPFISRRSKNAEYVRRASECSLRLTPVHPENPRNPGDLYTLSTAFSLGFTESELLDKICGMLETLNAAEQSLFIESNEEQQLALEDRTYRSLALLQSARLLTREEFLQNWSAVRAGCVCGILKLDAVCCNELLFTGLTAPFEQFITNENETSPALAGRAAAVRLFMEKENMKCL